MKSPETLSEARLLLQSSHLGILSTLSVSQGGYPFGSITPFVLNYDGAPYILISTLAEHTHNIDADGRVSLLTHQNNPADPQAAARLTLIGDASRTTDSKRSAALRSRYLRYFPNAAAYFETHDFYFYEILVRKARYIGGFGEIHWLEPAEFLLPNPLEAEEDDMVGHVNADHLDALAACCRAFHGVHPKTVRLVGVDPDGFDVFGDGILHRFVFSNRATDAVTARTAFIELTQKARALTDSGK